jgi:hypothetical protein
VTVPGELVRPAGKFAIVAASVVVWFTDAVPDPDWFRLRPVVEVPTVTVMLVDVGLLLKFESVDV